MHFDDASKALVELAASRHNAFHTLEAADIVSTRRLRRAEKRGELTRLHSRVWSVTALGRPPGQATRASALAVSGAAAAHLNSVWLHRWLGRAERPPDGPPEIWVPRSARTNARSANRFWCSRIDPGLDVTTVDHIPTLNAAATLCLLGRRASIAVVERCLDEFSRSHSMTWLADTFDRLHVANCGGTTTLAKILDDPKRVDGVTDSWFERVIADLCARSDMPPLELQHGVEVDDATYRLDLAFPALRLGIEAHSRSFHWGPEKVDADNRRDLALSAAGWHILYVTWSQLRDPEGFVNDVARVLAARRAAFAGANDHS